MSQRPAFSNDRDALPEYVMPSGSRGPSRDRTGLGFIRDPLEQWRAHRGVELTRDARRHAPMRRRGPHQSLGRAADAHL
jgi:hypothetical protein